MPPKNATRCGTHQSIYIPSIYLPTLLSAYPLNYSHVTVLVVLVILLSQVLQLILPGGGHHLLLHGRGVLHPPHH